MNNTLDEILDPWMNTVHGNLYKDSSVIRLATLVFCMSLPKKLSDNFSGLTKGDSTVTVHLKPTASGYMQSGYTPSNVLEYLLQATAKELTQKVSIPFRYNKELHLQGAGFLKSFISKNFNCDVQVTTVNKVNLNFELFHRPTMRYIGSFTLSD